MTAGDSGTVVVMAPGSIASTGTPLFAGTTRLPLTGITGQFQPGQMITIDPLGDADTVTVLAVTLTVFTITPTALDHLVSGTLVVVVGSYTIDPNASVFMLVQHVASPVPAHQTYPAAIGPGGYTATYITTGKEFLPPGGGEFNLALQIVGPGSPPSYGFTSPWWLERVHPQLDP